MSQAAEKTVISFKVEQERADRLEDQAWDNRIHLSELMRSLVHEYEADNELQETVIADATE